MNEPKKSSPHKTAKRAATGIARRFSRSAAAQELTQAQSHEEHVTQETNKLISEINTHVAAFRDLLINIGQSRDSPQLREKIRKLRRQCVEECRATNHLLLPQVKSDVAEGIPVDNQNFVLLFCLAQLFIRELKKCKRLVLTVQMDMTDYLANKPGPSGLTVLNQIVLCRQLAPDFHQEELQKIHRDTDEIRCLLAEMQEYLPKEDNGKNLAFQEETFMRWYRRRRKQTALRWQKILKVNCR